MPAVFLSMKKPETPWYAKFFAVVTVAYALSPIDLIPDFIPLLGYIDDLVILPPVLLTISIYNAFKYSSACFISSSFPKLSR